MDVSQLLLSSDELFVRDSTLLLLLFLDDVEEELFVISVTLFATLEHLTRNFYGFLTFTFLHSYYNVLRLALPFPGTLLSVLA